MTKKIFLGVLIVLLSMFATADAKKKIEGQWRLDGNASAELRNFRWMTDDWKIDARGKEPTRQGMDTLNASASAQPSVAALSTLKTTIHEREPESKIFIIDLRQETHGFANSLPVSWHVKHNAGNIGKNSAEVEAYEVEQLNSLRGVDTTFNPLGNDDKQLLKPITIIPRVIETERDAVQKLGLNYQRFAVTDMQFPTPEIVDEFIAFVINLPQNAWLHFHCHAGHGRTTTFLVMYDIMKNPNLSLTEICKRQYLLGGTNLLLEPEGDDYGAKHARDRAKKIRLFYEFIQGTRAEQIGLQWSEYVQLGMRN